MSDQRCACGKLPVSLVCFCVPVSLVSVSLSACLPVCLSLSLSLSVSHHLELTQIVDRALQISNYLCLCLSFCLSNPPPPPSRLCVGMYACVHMRCCILVCTRGCLCECVAVERGWGRGGGGGGEEKHAACGVRVHWCMRLSVFRVRGPIKSAVQPVSRRTPTHGPAAILNPPRRGMSAWLGLCIVHVSTSLEM